MNAEEFWYLALMPDGVTTRIENVGEMFHTESTQMYVHVHEQFHNSFKLVYLLQRVALATTFAYLLFFPLVRWGSCKVSERTTFCTSQTLSTLGTEKHQHVESRRDCQKGPELCLSRSSEATKFSQSRCYC